MFKPFPHRVEDYRDHQEQISQTVKKPTITLFHDRDLKSLPKPSLEDYFTTENLTRFLRSKIHSTEYLRTSMKLLDEIKWNQPFIILPNINLVRYDRIRFKFTISNDRFIEMVNRQQVVQEYFDFFNENQILYLYGPTGIGKSFIMYQLVAKLIPLKDKRVVYINMAEDFLIPNCLRIVKTIVDNDNTNTIFTNNEYSDFMTRFEAVEKVMKISPTDCMDRFLSLLEDIRMKYHKAGIKFIFAIDQINNIMPKINQKDNVYSKQLEFFHELKHYGKLIVSASTDNEIEQLKISVSFRLTPPLSFNEEEFNVYRCQRGYETIVKTEHQRNKVMELTGGLPIELDTFFQLRMPSDSSLEKRLQMYEDAFKTENSLQTLGKWRDKYTKEDEMNEIHENMYAYVFRKPMDLKNSLYDKRLLTEIENEGNTYLVGINEIAKSLFYRKYKPFANDELNQRFLKILQNSRQAVMGIEIERYLGTKISNMAFSEKLELKVKDYKNEEISILVLTNFDSVEFEGLFYKPGLEFEKNSNYFFIPKISNYPGYSFFYYQAARYEEENPKFFCIQVTNKEDTLGQVYHTYKLIEQVKLKEAIQSWKIRLPHRTEFYEIYIVNRKYWPNIEQISKCTEDNQEKLRW